MGSLRCESELLILWKLGEKRSELDPSIRSRPSADLPPVCLYRTSWSRNPRFPHSCPERELVLIHQTSLGEILEWGCCRKWGTWYLRKTWTLFCFYSGVSDSQTALRNRERVKERETERVWVKDEREWDCERKTTALPALIYCLQADRRSHVIQYSNTSTAQCGNEIWGPSTCPRPRKKRERKIEMHWEVRN